MNWKRALVVTMIGAGAVGAILMPSSATTSLECALCEWTMGKVENYLANNVTETIVENVLDKVCTITPKSYQETCINLIDTYFPYLVDLFLSKETPSVICNQVHAC